MVNTDEPLPFMNKSNKLYLGSSECAICLKLNGFFIINYPIYVCRVGTLSGLVLLLPSENTVKNLHVQNKYSYKALTLQVEPIEELLSALYSKTTVPIPY